MDKNFEGLQKRLEELDFPILYMFKFIVKSDLEKIALVESMFNTETAVITRKESSKGAFVSITVKEVMVSAKEVLGVYLRASKIEGVISL